MSEHGDGIRGVPDTTREEAPVSADLIGATPNTPLLDSTDVLVPSGWTRTQSGFVVPAHLADNIDREPSPLSLLLADKVLQTPSWVAALDRWATAATRAANVVVKVVESVAPVVESAVPAVQQASQWVAHVIASPRTVEVLEAFVGLSLLAEQVEAEGGDTEAFVLVMARMHLGIAGMKPDPFLRSKLRQVVRRQGGEFTLRYLMNLLGRHRQRLAQRIEAEHVEEDVLLVRRGIKQFGSVKRALEVLALRGQTREQVLKEMIPGIAFLEKRSSLDGLLSGKVASQIRREGFERPDDPGKVIAVEPEQLLKHADELELTAFAERELIAKKIHDASLSLQELESFTFGTILGNKEAAEHLGRPANQVGVEKDRARKKLRSTAVS